MVSVVEWLDDQNYQDTQLDAACKDNVEVMVNADAYYAFPIIYKDQIQQALDSL